MKASQFELTCAISQEINFLAGESFGAKCESTNQATNFFASLRETRSRFSSSESDSNARQTQVTHPLPTNFEALATPPQIVLNDRFPLVDLGD